MLLLSRRAWSLRRSSARRGQRGLWRGSPLEQPLLPQASLQVTQNSSFGFILMLRVWEHARLPLVAGMVAWVAGGGAARMLACMHHAPVHRKRALEGDLPLTDLPA